MTIEESKEKLKKDGYTFFELEEFDKDFYNFLLPFKCNNEKNLKDKFTYLRVNAMEEFDHSNPKKERIKIHIAEDFDSFENAFEKKNEVVELLSKHKDLLCSQMWFYNDMSEIITNSEEIDVLKKYIDNLIRYYFDFEETQELSLFAPSFTYYDVGCHLGNHSDGTGTGRVCSLLFYLNEDYDAQDGGCLVLNDKQLVVPKFGRVAIIDLQTFDIPHMVMEVVGGIGRYAMLTFIKKKEEEYIHSDYDKKKNLI